MHALLTGNESTKLVYIFAEERPAALDVLHQRVRLILGNNADAAESLSSYG